MVNLKNKNLNKKSQPIISFKNKFKFIIVFE